MLAQPSVPLSVMFWKQRDNRFVGVEISDKLNPFRCKNFSFGKSNSGSSVAIFDSGVPLSVDGQ